MKKSTGSRGRIFTGYLFLITFLIITSGCSKDNTNDTGNPTGNPNAPKPGANEVWMQGSAFNPDKITVTAGTTITWTNKDGSVHTVTSDTGLFDSGNISANGTFSHKFSTAGTFLYHCAVHTTMTGSVVVN
ncbi:MAG: cupredoxin domain-containing protein [Bacteroidia bacterium]|nr:cupredoxin domain-containing protein [Bacteroidia bacterium]